MDRHCEEGDEKWGPKPAHLEHSRGMYQDRTLNWQGIAVKPVYAKEDSEDVKPEIPGAFPYTRGPHATMYTQKPWTIRQARLHALPLMNAVCRIQHCRGEQQVLSCKSRGRAAGAVRGIRSCHTSWVRDIANPLNFRYDSDNPRVRGDVGMAGVAIDSVEDMKVLGDVSESSRM